MSAPMGPVSEASVTAEVPLQVGSQTRHQACERCWKRKQKCDKLLPSCSSCAELGIQCNARKTDIAAVLSKHGSISHHTFPGYVASLKRKIEELEHVRQQKRARCAIDSRSPESVQGAHLAGGRNAIRTLSSSSNQASLRRDSTAVDDGSVRATMGEIGFLFMSAMAEPRDQSEDFARHLALENMIIAAVSTEEMNSAPSGARNNGLFKRPAAVHSIMASRPVSITREATEDYILRYLEEARLLFVHLDEVKLMREYENVLVDHQAGRNTDNHGLSPIASFNIYMAIAIGSLLSPESNRLESFTASLHATSMKLFPVITSTGDDLAVISCILLLIMFSIFSSQGGSTWNLVGLAMKKCITLRLHKEADDPGISDIDRDERRCVFWSTYILDRSISSIMDRPFSIQDEDISVQLPQKLNDLDTASPGITLPEHIISQARLISSVRMRKRHKIFDHSNLSFWRETPLAVNLLAKDRQLVSRRVEQLACRTLLQIVTPEDQAAHIKSSSIGNYRNIKEDAISSCARLISQLYDQADHHNFVGSFVDGYDIFSAGVVHLCLSAGSSHQSGQYLFRVSKITNKCLTLLTIIGERFSFIKGLRRALNALLDAALEGRNTHEGIQQDLLQSLPPSVPRRIRQFIEHFVTARSATSTGLPRT